MSRITLTAASRIGRVRNNNEDMVLAFNKFIRSDIYATEFLTENTDTSERILQSIGADELAHERNPQLKENQTMKKLLKSAYSYFEGKKILEGKNVPEVLESLDNGKLKKELKTHLEKEFKAEMERNKNANRLVIQTADPVQVQPQAPHIGS